VHAFTRDYLAEGLEGDSDGLDAAVSRIVTVRRLLVTASQVEELVPESARIESTGAERMAGWRWPFKVQAEAVLPEDRDRIVINAIDALHDLDLRDEVIAEEKDMRSAARATLRKLLATEPEQ
jgi:hypothetical protein